MSDGMDRVITWKRLSKYTFIFLMILLAVNTLMATYMVENIQMYVDNGFLELVEMEQTDEGLKVTYDGTNIKTYKTYQDAIIYGDENRFVFADNGFAYKNDTIFGSYTYVVDYRWLAKGVYDEDDLKDYLQNNKLMQVIRTSYLSNGVLILTLVYPFLLIIGYYLMPILLVVVAKVYVELRVVDSSKNEVDYVKKMKRLTQSQFLNRLFTRYEDGLDIPIFTAIFSVFMGSTMGYFYSMESYMGEMVLMYILVLILITLFYAFTEYGEIDLQRLKTVIDSGERIPEGNAELDELAQQLENETNDTNNTNDTNDKQDDGNIKT